ncbi:hypothetical protein HMSSN139_45730 [Paenibacillus sp. HMSSN-139]|nr:hypothetical protein HMSSN139_45730 [Paenibacillus sp. HMSSN-139]
MGGAILAFATTLALTATQQTSLGIVGAVIFPVGFVIIVLLGLELVTGSFALIPLAVLERRVSVTRMLSSFGWVILGHVIGCAVYAILYGLTITKMGTDLSHPLVQALIQTSEAKTLAYKHMGGSGLALVTIKAVLCNWMVTLGVVMAMTSKSTAGKIVAMWLPILIFLRRVRACRRQYVRHSGGDAARGERQLGRLVAVEPDSRPDRQLSGGASCLPV